MWHLILLIVGYRTYFLVTERTNVSSQFTWWRPKGRRLASEQDIEAATVASLELLYFRRAFDANTAMTNSMAPIRVFFSWGIAGRSYGGVPLGWVLRQESLRFPPRGLQIFEDNFTESHLPYLAKSSQGITSVCFRSEATANRILRLFLERRYDEVVDLLRPLMARWRHFEQRLSEDLTTEHREFFAEQSLIVQNSMENYQGEQLILERQLG